jgi:uncharacterized protein (TIGR01244 family)
MNHLASILVSTAFLASCSTIGGGTATTTDRLEPYECGTVTRLHTFGGIFLASQPKKADLAHAKDGGVKTVINLRKDEEMPFDEREVVTSLGMTYVHLPFSGVAELTDSVFDRGRELLNTAARPLMMHCKSANRVGAIWLAWRVVDGGITFDAALAEAKTVGVKSPAYVEKAREYIAHHAAE